jgi:predicted HTH domain antitoxin
MSNVFLSCLLSTMSEITVDIPEDALEALKESPETAGATVRMAAAAKLYEMGRLSTGAAARLGGVPRSVFLTRLADYGVDTFDLTDEDLDEETRLA